MKSFTYLITLILTCVFLAGCGNDQYSIEKQYYWAQKRAAKIFKNPAASPPRELEKVVGILNNFIRNYPKNKLALQAEFDIARLYITKEEYDKARLQLRSIVNKYNELKDICAEATFLIGNSYQIEDKWNLALEQYKKIMQDYPATLRGLDIPVYIAQYYKIKYQPDKMLAAFYEAINHYKGLALKYPKSVLAYQAEMLVSSCYAALKDWNNVINSLNTVIENYKDKIKADGILMQIAFIYSKELKDKAKEKEILERLIRDYPKSKLVKRATVLLEELEKR
ncbi:MAG: tetratricopeptide repeat protein [Candidatus Omnitrophota bacterium]